MPNPNIVPRWKKGDNPYKEFLTGLTPKEYELHMAKRRAKVDMRNEFRALVKSQKEEWLQKLYNGLGTAAHRAEHTGDIQTLEKLFKLLDIAPVEKSETKVEATVTAVEVDFKDNNES